jgi:hypothetical protein
LRVQSAEGKTLRTTSLIESVRRQFDSATRAAAVGG